MRGTYSVSRLADGGVIMTLMISLILVTALASTVVTQSDNAREISENMHNTQGLGYDNTRYKSAAPIFGMYPLLWAIVGLAVVAGVVISLVKF